MSHAEDYIHPKVNWAVAMKCKVCKAEAEVSLRSHNAAFCARCFLDFFRRQVERGIESQKLFTRKDRILIALSGGKDSLALALVLSELGYNITGLFIDLAIPDSSSVAREHVKDFCARHSLPLTIIDMAAEGLAIPEVKARLRRPICSVCGKIKRHYFNQAAIAGGYDCLATGHNLDDETGRLMSNTLRWDRDYLASQGPALPAENGFCRKVKPLWRLGEFETANYAFLRGINHHKGACPYSGGASFTTLKNWIHELELKMPGRKLDFYQSFLANGRPAFAGGAVDAPAAKCSQCGAPIWEEGLCGVCRIKALMWGEEDNGVPLAH